MFTQHLSKGLDIHNNIYNTHSVKETLKAWSSGWRTFWLKHKPYKLNVCIHVPENLYSTVESQSRGHWNVSMWRSCNTYSLAPCSDAHCQILHHVRCTGIQVTQLVLNACCHDWWATNHGKQRVRRCYYDGSRLREVKQYWAQLVFGWVIFSLSALYPLQVGK